MKPSRLKEIMALADEGSATVNECIEIAGAALESSSRHSTEIKDLLKNILQKQAEIDNKLNYLLVRNAPIYAARIEDEIEEEEDINMDEAEETVAED